MNSKSNSNASALTKLQQTYWEAKRNLNNSLGTHDDDCWISTDSDLDSKIQLLQEADNSYNVLLVTLLQYKRTLCRIMTVEKNLGSALVEYGIADRTLAGKLMILSGRAISQNANQRHRLKSNIMELYHEVQTFQFKATVDVLQTVSKMENVRKSYRSGLMWMKNESQNLDPDVVKKMRKFRKVQEHIKNLKTRFDATKFDTMQKIDLYLLSRCNLFSKTLVPYRDIFCKISLNYSKLTTAVVQNIPSCSLYTFETVKELNECSSKPYLQSLLSLRQKNRDKASNKRNLKVNESKSSNAQPKSITKAMNSETAKSTQTKKVRFKNPLESEVSTEKPSSSKAFLINLMDDQNNLLYPTKHPFESELSSEKTTIPSEVLINLNEDENTASNHTKLQSKVLNSMSGKYSEDLLSLQMYSNMSGDFINQSEEKKDFDDEFEKCFEGLNDSHIADEVYEDLQFWSLMEGFSDSKDAIKEENYKIESPINPVKIQQEDRVAKWENILIEFDPYNENISNILYEKAFREDC